MIELFITGFGGIRVLDVIDILLVSILLYEVYNLIKGTNAINIFIGILAIYLIWKLVKIFQMELLGEILGQFISVGVIALIVVFQPEIRKFLLLLGTPGFFSRGRRRFLFWRISLSDEDRLLIDPIIQAVQKMSSSKTGALLVFGRKNELSEVLETGEILDARISEQLLMNIFFKNSPLHDGAVIIADNRIRAARCILPVSNNNTLPMDLGLRHRSAVGITERSDALAIVVSEQTGSIAFSKEGNIMTDVKPVQLKSFLEEEFIK